MQLECQKHLQLLSYYCPRSTCKIPICSQCIKDHKDHGVLSSKAFAEYALKEVKRRENEIESILSESEDLDKRFHDALTLSAKEISVSIAGFIDCMRTTTTEVIERAKATLEGSIESLKKPKSNYKFVALMQEREMLANIKMDILLGKDNDHFLAIQQAWEKFQQRSVGSALSEPAEPLPELIKALESIQNFSEDLLRKITEIRDTTSNTIVQLKQSTSSQPESLKSTPSNCAICEHEGDVYLLYSCGHGICFPCAQREIEEKICAKGLKVIDNELECYLCGFERTVTHVVHQDCGCFINVKRFGEHLESAYYWDRDTGKFQWPVCARKKPLRQEDVFFIYGNIAFTFFDEFLPHAKIPEAAYKHLEYMVVCKELHKENVANISEILEKGKSIEHIVWRGQRLQVLIPGIFLALELAERLKTLNLSTNSLGDIGVKHICQLYNVIKKVEMLDLCTFSQITKQNSKQWDWE